PQQSTFGEGTLGLPGPVRRLIEPVDAHRAVRGGALEPATEVRGLFGVRVTAGIEDEQLPAGRDLDAEQVVVAVSSVTEWATIKDEEALKPVGHVAVAPAAALEVVPTAGKLGETIGRRSAASPRA